MWSEAFSGSLFGEAEIRVVVGADPYRRVRSPRLFTPRIQSKKTRTLRFVFFCFFLT